MSNSNLSREFRLLLNEAQEINHQLELLPNGRMYFLKNGKYTNAYHIQCGVREYLPKSKHELKVQLAKKEYLAARLEDLLPYLDFYSSNADLFADSPSHTDQLLQDSNFKPLLSDISALSSELNAWANAPFPSNAPFPEKRIHNSLPEIMVRSKSEVFIANALHLHGIPFRYECDFAAGLLTLHPDFTIRHPRSGKLFLWEHHGLADDPRYMREAFNKQALYIANGFYPSINLILSYETKDHPLTQSMVEHIIREYFL